MADLREKQLSSTEAYQQVFKMNERPKKKLCWNCEGNVVETEDNCPYCGVYLHPGSLSGQVERASLFSPPYPQQEETHEEAPPVEAAKPAETIVSAGLGNTLKEMLLSLVMLSSGVFFFLFSLAIFLFSHNGQMTLTWSISSGWLFFLSGLPLVIFGWRSLQKLE